MSNPFFKLPLFRVVATTHLKKTQTATVTSSQWINDQPLTALDETVVSCNSPSKGLGPAQKDIKSSFTYTL